MEASLQVSSSLQISINARVIHIVTTMLIGKKCLKANFPMEIKDIPDQFWRDQVHFGMVTLCTLKNVSVHEIIANLEKSMIFPYCMSLQLRKIKFYCDMWQEM